MKIQLQTHLRRQDGALNYCQKSKATKQIKTKKHNHKTERGKKANNEQNGLVHVNIIMCVREREREREGGVGKRIYFFACLINTLKQAFTDRFTRTTVTLILQTVKID